MNIYEMYYENDKTFGFWVVRNTWENSIAKITSIEGVEEGEEIPGVGPYYNNLKVIDQIKTIVIPEIYMILLN
jgi:hypothetical protein